jgi:hypothetical protein
MNKYHIYGSLPQNICDTIENSHKEVMKTPELLGSTWWETPHITVVYGIKTTHIVRCSSEREEKVDIKNLKEDVNKITNNFVEKFKELKEIVVNLGSVHIKVREKFLVLCLTVSSDVLNDIINHFIREKIGTFNFKCNELHITIGVFKNSVDGVVKAYEIANMFRKDLEEKTISLRSLQLVDDDDRCYDVIGFKEV